MDDDDGNLANGTPNACLIYRQFDLHSCGAERWPGIPAPSAAASASPSVLWPADHSLVPVNITVTPGAPCESAGECRIASVASNEPEDDLGDGSTEEDWIIEGMTVQLRAERSGRGGGRVYTVTVECSDSAGRITTTTVHVTVPKRRP